MYKQSLAIALATLLPAPALASDGWLADFDQAVEAAKKEQKDLLVDFTGSDWCKWCVKLDEEVFGHEEFIKVAREKFVLVALDFPRSDEAKAKVPNPDRNEEVNNKYGVTGYPTILMITAEGQAFASLHYQEGGVEPYLEYLEKERSEGRAKLDAAQKLVTDFKTAEETGKVAAWEALVVGLAALQPGSPFAPLLAKPIFWAFEADPKNEKGLKLRAVKALLAAGQADEQVIAAGIELDPKNESGLYEEIVDAVFQQVSDEQSARAAVKALDGLLAVGFKNQEAAFAMTFSVARWLMGPLDDKEAAKKYAAKALEIGTEREQLLDALKEMIADMEADEEGEEHDHEHGEDGEHGDGRP